MSQLQSLNFVQDYWIDAWQRSILSLDVLRERGNISLEHSARTHPTCCTSSRAIRDGRTLPGR